METLTKPSFVLICPLCGQRMERRGIELRCGSGHEFGYQGPFPNLIVGERFDDEEDASRIAREEEASAYFAQHYLIPHLRAAVGSPGSRTVLSLGCGAGRDLDLLVEAGFDAVGIDCGNRSRAWTTRRHPERFLLANGKHLPFETASFDAVYCSCVFPHIGVEGDSNRLAPNYQEERARVAREIGRVLKPGGFALISSPNRWCPLDLFHGRSPSQPWPQPNSPFNRFLLSAGDYRQLFEAAGCCRPRLLPVAGYWGFLQLKSSWKGRLAAFPVEAIFRLVSQPSLRFLRGSPINPWLVLLVQRHTAASTFGRSA